MASTLTKKQLHKCRKSRLSGDNAVNWSLQVEGLLLLQLPPPTVVHPHPSNPVVVLPGRSKEPETLVSVLSQQALLPPRAPLDATVGFGGRVGKKPGEEGDDGRSQQVQQQPEPVEARLRHRDRPWRCRRSTSQEEEEAKHQQDHNRLRDDEKHKKELAPPHSAQHEGVLKGLTPQPRLHLLHHLLLLHLLQLGPSQLQDL